MTERTELIIIGAGQAGLATSYCLTQQRVKHLILEQGRVAETWRNRWDSFTLVTPAWTVQLPGFPYQGSDPDGFMGRDEVVAHLERYAVSFDLPVRSGVRVTALEQKPGGRGYLLETADTVFEADSVVVATGAFPYPKVPAISAEMSADILQIHTNQYRNPDALPPGNVLVVGTGQSGCQIAEELNESGRKVFLSVSSCGRAPRRYRGKDIMWWRNELGIWDVTVDKLPSPGAKFDCTPHLSGKAGGHEINLRQLAIDGVTLVGYLRTVRGSELILAPNLEENLTEADDAAARARRQIDEYVVETGMQVPEERTTRDIELGAKAEVKPIPALDMKSAGITTVVWATGYKYDFSWVRIPVFDATGYPLHERGITTYPGLYFVGLQWLYKAKSELLGGVGEDATYLASVIAASASKSEPK